MFCRNLSRYFLRGLLLILVLVVSACASKQTIDKDPTIALLAERAAVIEPQALPALSRADVQRTYERLAKNTNNDGLKAIALQRLADLALEDRQAELAGESGADKATEAAIEKKKKEDAVAINTPSVEEVGGADEQQQTVDSKNLVVESSEQKTEQAIVKSAIHQYERLLTLYPSYAGNDRVMYQLARS